MNLVKKYTTLAVLLLAPALSSQAALINLTPFGAQPDNSGEGTIENWVAGLVSSYNAANNPDLPAPGDQVFRVNVPGDTPPAGFPSNSGTSITLPVGIYDYVALHWGGPASGLTPNYQAFYIGDIAGTQTFTNGDQQGLSWYAYFSPNSPPTIGTPDSGASVVLLGMALLSLGLLRRKFARKN